MELRKLKQFAINQDGNVIPKLVDKLKDLEILEKYAYRNQMFYAALSLKYYSTDPLI